MYSENLKRVRTELRYTLDAMAEKLGVKTRTYVSWERENKMPPIELGTLLNTKLNVNLNWFCTGEGDMFNTAPQSNSTDKEEIIKIVEEYLDKRAKSIIDT